MASENEVKDEDMLGMADEDFLNLAGPPDEVTPPQTQDEPQPQPSDVVETDSAAATAEGDQPPLKEDDPAAAAQPAADDKNKAKDGSDEPAAAPAQTEAVNYEDAYKKIMAPFKANGKMVEVRSPEEAVALMQMGANYTRRMQEIAPHRKVLLMLENNNLLDEGKLSYLIDLDKKNPEAIKKLVKDAGIDPLDIDTSAEPAYREGNHRVSDAEAAFRVVLDDLSSNENGKQTLQVINSTWDQASKELLWENPGVMNIINQQREIGVYDRILAEVDRRRTLGQIPGNKPFLKAYQEVGQEMAAANAFGDIVQPAQQQQREPATPVASRAAVPKPAVVNGEKANAAAPTKAVAKPAKVVVNPLAMADDDFLKQFQGRL